MADVTLPDRIEAEFKLSEIATQLLQDREKIDAGQMKEEELGRAVRLSLSFTACITESTDICLRAAITALARGESPLDATKLIAQFNRISHMANSK
jgi:hypothetical protein